MFQARLSMLRLIVLPALLAGGLGLAGGCAGGPNVIPPDQRTMIDRQLVEYPAGVDLQMIAEDLTGPVDCAVDKDGTLIVAEGGRGKYEPRIYGIRKDGSLFDIYPVGRRFPQPLRWLQGGFRIYGPVGGIAVNDGKVYVSHRDKDDFGVITAFTYDGQHTTIVGKLPAQGDYGMGDVAIHPDTGRLYFGIGAATNSGVVGLDNWAAGWVKNHPKFSDRPWLPPGQSLLKLLGYRFDTPNPLAGLFGGKDVAGTAPFQPFNSRYRGRIPRAENNRPTAAVFSCDPLGGGLTVEAYGVRYARGIAFDEYGSAFMTNNGMELRGTRPVKDDPDAVLSIVRGTWYGWPDFSADLRPISSEEFRPPEEMLVTYQELSEVIDHRGSGLDEPSRYRNSLVQAVLPPLSGAAGMAFVPDVGPLSVFNGHAIVALSGDRAPFATSGRKLRGPTGYRVVRVNTIDKEVADFVRNTAGVPRSRQKLSYHHVSLERPMSVKFDLSDGSMYIVDFGVLEMRKGKEFVKERTGRIFKLVPQVAATTQPTTHTAVAPSQQQSSSLEVE